MNIEAKRVYIKAVKERYNKSSKKKNLKYLIIFAILLVTLENMQLSF